ncbi:hypothetical protein CRM22_010282 [Opisthorchis felineus]|uniref:Uncharacterized protein n=1 Tax=Opisthorchis felineus TaxID=147828 RepID=A0A4S2L0B1_OPIFE|nr:hypothetical protein CRM22_010282 [Opisthorchis felineus]
MRILASLFTFSLLEGLLARGIPEYDQCVEKCGEDPLDDPVESIRYDACRDKCVEDGLNLCLGEIIDANRRSTLSIACFRVVYHSGLELQKLLRLCVNFVVPYWKVSPGSSESLH